MQKTIEESELREKVVDSNGVHKNDTCEISDLKIVPKLLVHGTVAKNSDKKFDTEDSLSYYSDEVDEFNLCSKEAPFVNIGSKDVYTEYDSVILDKLSVVTCLDDMFDLNDTELFLVEDDCDRYYICSVRFQLVGTFTTESYVTDVLFSTADSLTELKETEYTVSQLNYEFNGESLNIFEDKPWYVKYHPFNNLLEYLIILGSINMFTFLVSDIAYMIFLYSCIIGFAILNLSSIDLDYIDETVSVFSTNSDVIKLDYLDVFKEEEDDSIESEKLEKAEVVFEDGKLVCKDRDICWDISSDEFGLLTEDATEFFVKNVGVDNVSDGFVGFITSQENLVENDYLKSDCGDWYLVV